MKYSLADFRKCVAEFRQYGYNPYDSETLAEWWSVTQKIHSGELA